MRLLTATLTAAALVATAGCKVDTEGESGQLRFAWDDPDQLFTDALDHPIAVGTAAAILVRTKERALVDRIQGAQVGPEAIATIDGVEREVVWIRGHRPGEVTLKVKADGRTDTVTLRVAEADTTQIVALNDAQLAFTGGVEPLAVRRFAAGQPLMGEAHLAQFTIEPAEGASVFEDGANHRFTVRYGAPGDLQIVADGDPVRRHVVSLDAAARLATFPSPDAGTPIPLNSAALIGLRAFDSADAQIAALGDVVQVAVADPRVCRAVRGDYLGFAGLRLEPVSEGECAVTLTLGALEETISFPIVPTEDE